MVKISWPINVVIVEDNYPDAEYLVELLQEEEDNYVWENFVRLGPAMEHVSEGGTSVVLLDLVSFHTQHKMEPTPAATSFRVPVVL